MARDVIARSLSVRETEALVKKIVEGGRAAARSAPRRSRPTCTRAPPKIGSSSSLGTRVRIVRKGTRGRIEIDFVSEDELIRIYEQLTVRLRLGVGRDSQSRT